MVSVISEIRMVYVGSALCMCGDVASVVSSLTMVRAVSALSMVRVVSALNMVGVAHVAHVGSVDPS